MYLAAIVLLMFAAPAASVAVEAWRTPGSDWLWLIGKWFTFWAVGVRLFLAGINQSLRPQFTSEGIFHIDDPNAAAIVREIGFGNLAMGALGLASLVRPEWVVPAAIAGGLYLGLAGLGHLVRRERGLKEQAALWSDLAIFLLLTAFVVTRGPRVTAEELIEALELAPHPEGGWYRETWRATARDGERAPASAVYYVMQPGQQSRWNRVDAAEIWLWHAGDPVDLLIAASGADEPKTVRLGGRVTEGQSPQVIVPAGHWQSAVLVDGSAGYAFISCIVAPTFEFSGFELAEPGWAPGP